MKNVARRISTLLCGASLLAASTVSMAQGECGTGYITQVYGGGWNQDGLIIKVEYLAGSAAPNSYLNTGNLRFAPGLSEKRLDMIQGAALLALANGNKVQIYSHTNNAQGQPDCGNATQILVYRNSTT